MAESGGKVEKRESTGWEHYQPSSSLPPVPVTRPDLPLVSVVTPSYNQGPFIRETIESVLSQDYPNMEYWVIDGGSVDETLPVLAEYGQHPCFSYLSEPDEGQADAVNKGWGRVRGEIVGWLNSDDTYIRGALASQVDFLLHHSEVDVVYGDCLFTDAQGRVVESGPGRPFRLLELLRFTIPHQPTVFLRREAIRKAGPLDLSFPFSMDSEYWLRLHSLGFKFAYNPVAVATYRLHESSKTVSQHEKAYIDWERLIDLYAPETLRSRVLADLHLAIAIDEVRKGKVRSSLARALRAARTVPTPRLGLYLAILMDRLTGTSLYPFLLRKRTRRRS